MVGTYVFTSYDLGLVSFHQFLHLIFCHDTSAIIPNGAVTKAGPGGKAAVRVWSCGGGGMGGSRLLICLGKQRPIEFFQ